MAFVTEPLGKHHDRAAFRCGDVALDRWFEMRAGQDNRRDVARVFVSVNAAGAVTGFYSLSAFALSLDAVPAELAAKLPRYDLIPAALIGRLARDERQRGTGLGALLLADAIRRIIAVGRELAVFAIVVDAKDEAAAAFYQSFGFKPFPLHPERLFMLTATAVAAFGTI